MATWWAVTVPIRRWLLFAIALCCASALCIPLSSNVTLLYGLRFVQGLSAGFIDLSGIVDSVPPAPGSEFGSIQPNNASGNFTKAASANKCVGTPTKLPLKTKA